VSGLRQRIGEATESDNGPVRLETVRGVGYRLQAEEK
jgi:DNA-binding response OmpR family regulator